MEERYFIGVDSGSQSTKVLIFNQKGETITSASEPLRPMMERKPGYVEHPDDDLWDSLKSVLRKVMREFKGDISQIKGLGLCTIRCCRVFMKADGTLAEPIMSWMDVRSYAPFEDSDAVRYTSPTTGYVTHRLTGAFKDTAANAFQWQFPIDLDTWNWSTDEECIRRFKIPREKLLELQMPGTTLGYVTKEAAAATGLPEGLPVVATANDKAVEALGSGLVTGNKALISLGTYIAAMVCGAENRADPVNYWVNLSCVPNRYLYESNGIRRGMWHISWFASVMGAEYAEKAKQLNLPVEVCLDREAQKVPAGSDGLLTIPDWLAPADQLYRKGVIIGFDHRHTRAHIYRSIMEGIAMTLKNNYDGMIHELGIQPDSIILSGGGSNSDLFMQIFADLYGVKTMRNEINGAASLGAAICAAVASGTYSGFDEAVANMVRVRDTFTPDMKNFALYSKINSGAYRGLPQMMEPVLKAAHEASM